MSRPKVIPRKRRCPFCGQPMQWGGDFPKLNLPMGPLSMLHLLWRNKGQVVRYRSFHVRKTVAHVYSQTIREELRAGDLPWVLENERDVGYRLIRVST